MKKLKLISNKLFTLWKRKGIKNKFKIIIILFFVFIFLFPIVIITVFNSFSKTFINKSIKVVQKDDVELSTLKKKKDNQSEEINSNNYIGEKEIIPDTDNKNNNANSNDTLNKHSNNGINEKQVVEQLEEQEIQNQIPIQLPNGNTMEIETLNYINNLRTSLGISVLSWDNDIYSYAKIRAEEITSVYSHIRPNGQSSIISAPISIHAENLAYGQTSASEIFNDWKSSLNHYQNFVNSTYTKGTVASAIKDGVYYWVFLAY